MKNYIGNKRISVRAGTADAELYRALIEQDPGSKRQLIEPGLVIYLMSDGTTIELYGSGCSYPQYLFSGGNVVLGFRVQNIAAMLSLMEGQGAKLLGNIETVCTKYKFCYLRTKEDTVIGLYEMH